MTRTYGGAVMGTDPTTSALNGYLLSSDISNLDTMGATAFPRNAGCNQRGRLRHSRTRLQNASRTQYPRNPGPLVVV